MKKKNIILGLGLFLAVGLALSSCTKNDDSTIVPIGTEDYVKPFTSVVDLVFSSVPEATKTQFLQDFGDLPDGPVPPKIEGSFKMSPKQRVATNTGLPVPTIEQPDLLLRFSNQHNELIQLDLNESTENFSDTVFVRGNDNAFAVYFIENKSYEVPLGGAVYHVKMERGVIMKGKMTDRGISDFRYATIVKKAEDDSGGLIDQYDSGTYFIYKDGDGVAEKFDW